MGATPRPVLHICVTCRRGEPPSDAPRPGKLLFDAVAARAPAVELRPVECLANCEHGCSAAISADRKWTYLLGRLAPDLADDLLAYAEAYDRAGNGTVMPSRRPASLRDMIIGRVPPLAGF